MVWLILEEKGRLNLISVFGGLVWMGDNTLFSSERWSLLEREIVGFLVILLDMLSTRR